MSERSVIAKVLGPAGVAGIVAIAAILVLGAGSSWGGAAALAATTTLVVSGAVAATTVRRHARDLSQIAGATRTDGDHTTSASATISTRNPLHPLALGVDRMREEIDHGAAVAVEKRILESAFGALEASIAIVAPDGRVAYANESFREFEVLRVDRIETNATVERLVTATRNAGRPLVETTVVGKPARTLRLGAAALDDGHVVVSAVDASESNRLSAVRRDFVADASHELKTPIAAIQSSAETLRVALAHGDLDAADKFTAYVIENTTRLSHLVNDLLDLSRIESETLDVSPIDLATIVIDQVDGFRTTATNQRIALEVDATTASVTGDANHLSMAVRNLIANAIQNTAERGTVQVGIHCDDTTAEVTVSDNGRGIPSRDLPRLFERFYRVDHARSRTDGGTGLGLAIVKHVAENHGGSIDVESALGEGSTFTLRIPRTQG